MRIVWALILAATFCGCVTATKRRPPECWFEDGGDFRSKIDYLKPVYTLSSDRVWVCRGKS